MILTSLLFALNLNAAPTIETVGDFYPVGKVGGTPLYTQKSKIETDDKGVSKLTSTIYGADQKVLMTEVATYAGTKVLAQTIEQRQKNEVYELKFADKNLKIERFSVNEKGERKLLKEGGEKNMSENLLTGPVSANFVKANWDDLAHKKTIEAKFAVMEIVDTVHFSFRLISLDDKAMVVEMKPSGFFIRMAAGLAGLDPIQMTLDVKTKRIIRYRGRTPLISASKDPVNSEIVYREISGATQ